ncbi:MAG: zinc finger BED domain-containing protein [Lentimicrobium sp.]|nr:zinc finger BED domain-containing protein [Lentimicrobium sp.]
MESLNQDDNANLSDFISKSAILDGKYFTIVKVADDNVKIKAKCNFCSKKTVISGSINALSNFTTHLKVSYFI